MAPDDRTARCCPTCGTPVPPGADVCPRCGMPGASSRGNGEALADGARAALSRRKTSADLLFLGGLLVGGPVMTVGGRLRVGLFLVLAGAVASVLRRYAGSSLGGAVALGAAAALSAAVLVNAPEPEATRGAEEEARSAYVAELAGSYAADGRVEARGPGLVTVWFFLPEEPGRDCGSVPAEEVRARLADLGFKRVVVSDRSRAGSVCSFQP